MALTERAELLRRSISIPAVSAPQRITEGQFVSVSGPKLTFRTPLFPYTFVILAALLCGDTIALLGSPSMFSGLFFKSDRRRRPRQLLNTSVRVFADSALIEATGINISDVGMGLFTVANLPVGSQVQVEVPVNGEVSRFQATVRYRALYLYGLEFHDCGDNRVEVNPPPISIDSLTPD